MSPQKTRIPQQLLDDCHHLGSLRSGELLLQRNAALPWFILYPDTELNDVLDLSEDTLHAVLADCAAVSRFLKETLGFPKVNFAGLGNVFPDMHLHVIGRREGDVCWPQPVWGNIPQGGAYPDAILGQWRIQLQAGIGLQLIDEQRD